MVQTSADAFTVATVAQVQESGQILPFRRFLKAVRPSGKKVVAQHNVLQDDPHKVGLMVLKPDCNFR
jgi:hypothetical protein